MIIFDQPWTGFFGRPIALVFLTLATISIFGAPARAALGRFFPRNGRTT